MASPTQRQTMRGIPSDKKRDVLSRLAPLMPKHKRLFWENLQSSDVRDLVVEDDEQ